MNEKQKIQAELNKHKAREVKKELYNYKVKDCFSLVKEIDELKKINQELKINSYIDDRLKKFNKRIIVDPVTNSITTENIK